MRPPISGEGGSAAPRAPRLARAGACACALTLLASAGARSGEPREVHDGSSGDPRATSAPEHAAPAERKPVCRVKISDKRGFVMAGLLLALEDGVYHVRGPDKKDIELREGDVSSVKFSPLKERKPKVAKPKHPGRPEGRDYRARPGLERRRDEPFRRLREAMEAKSSERQRRLSELLREGKLDEHIRKLASELRDARTGLQAGKLLAEIIMAHSVKREPLTIEQRRRLVESIADPAVRVRAMETARRLFRPPWPPPRRGPGEWRGRGGRQPAP